MNQPDDPGALTPREKRVLDLIASRVLAMGDGNTINNGNGNGTKLAWLTISALFVVITGEFTWFASSVVTLREDRAADRAEQKAEIRSLNDKMDMIISGKIVIIKESNGH